MNLNKEIVNKIKRYAKVFKKSDVYREDLADRVEREKFFQEALKKENLQSMDEFTFGKIISNLWATSGMWSNIDYKITKIIEANGIENLRKHLIDLLYAPDSIEIKFDRAIKNIKELGPASITEILAFFNPQEYGIWNKKARQALGHLGFENMLPLNKYIISGKEYKRYNQVLQEIGEILKKTGYKNVDLIVVDFFLYGVWTSIKEGTTIQEDEEFDHNEIRDHIREIGEMLGFEAEIERSIASGARVDVVWHARIGNLGAVTYVFEVQKHGSIDSLILNLQKASANPTVQKIIAVSDAKTIEKIMKEVEGLPESFLKLLAYWEVNDVENVYEKLSDAIREINKLQLVRRGFEK